MSQKPPVVPSAKPPPSATPKPTLIAFSVVKKDGRWHALAMKVRGREVLDERVIESSPWQAIAVDAVELVMKRTFLFDADPFREE